MSEEKEPVRIARWFERFAVVALVALLAVNGWGARKIYLNGDGISRLDERTEQHGRVLEKLTGETEDHWDAVAETKRQVAELDKVIESRLANLATRLSVIEATRFKAEDITPVWQEIAKIRELIASYPTEFPPTKWEANLNEKLDGMRDDIKDLTRAVNGHLQNHGGRE